MKIINLFGAPSAGKSTTMLGLTYEMKMLGLSVEKTDEFFKELILEETASSKFGGQLFVLAEQNRRLARLEGKNDFVITDCPLPLIDFYTKKDYIDGFEQLTINLYKKYDNINYFIERNHEFENEKRAHDEVQSNQISPKLLEYLNNHNIPYKVFKSGPDLIDEILLDLIEKKVVRKEHLYQSRNPKVRKMEGSGEPDIKKIVLTNTRKLSKNV